MELDLNLRVRVHELERYLADKVRHLPSCFSRVPRVVTLTCTMKS